MEKQGQSPHVYYPPADEEPFLIFANRYYLRKLNLDGSNYTLLKQVRPVKLFDVHG